MPWPGVHAFWSDERYVPHDHPLSNYRMAKDALLDHVGMPAEQVHPMPTHFPDPQAAARDYENDGGPLLLPVCRRSSMSCCSGSARTATRHPCSPAPRPSPPPASSWP